jgi:hypothetical protein
VSLLFSGHVEYLYVKSSPMKKFLLIALVSVCLNKYAQSQDYGYRTTDIGAEYQWTENSPALNLQFALNATTHHSFVGSVGIKTAFQPIEGSHDNEKGKGWGGSVGYRYYFSVLPKGFYVGARAHFWSLNMYHTADNLSPKTSVTIAQPSGEIGYTSVINDLFFITTYISAGQKVTVSGEQTFAYGKGFVASAGIAMGWRF